MRCGSVPIQAIAAQECQTCLAIRHSKEQQPGPCFLQSFLKEIRGRIVILCVKNNARFRFSVGWFLCFCAHPAFMCQGPLKQEETKLESQCLNGC